MQQSAEMVATETLALPRQLHGSWSFSRARSLARGPKQSGWPEWCTLIAYASLVAFAIPYHEPWADEAQAWQLARNLSLDALFKTYLRYEGSPGLWHLLLWVVARLHIGYAGLHWICGAIATAGVSLLIFKSPFPRYLKLSFPFTYFLLFQYAVIARSYVLAPLLLFTLAIWWKRSPWIVTLMLGLLANTSLHLAVLSGGLALVYAIDELRDGNLANSARRRKLLLCALVLVAFYAFAIWTAWPPRDVTFIHVRDDSSFAPRFFSALVVAICEPAYLSLVFWFVILLWFIVQRKIHYLLPALFFSLFCGEIHIAWWHAGLVVPCLICLLWISWPAPGTGPHEFDRTARSALIVMIVTQLLWSGYALYYDHYYAYSPDLAAAEFLNPYVENGTTIAVTYLRDANKPGRNKSGNAIMQAFPAVGILPYFDRNIYANTAYPFWWWSDKDQSAAQFKALLPSHPQIVLVELALYHRDLPIRPDHPEFVSLIREGYHNRATFCGAQPQALDLGETICHVVFEYSPNTDSSFGKVSHITNQ